MSLAFYYFQNNKETMFITVGNRVRAKWYKLDPPKVLSVTNGTIRLSGSIQELVGTVIRIYGDAPDYPTKMFLEIKTDKDELVRIDSIHIIEIL